MQEQELRSERAGILYDADTLRKSALEPGHELFSLQYWQNHRALHMAQGGRGSVAFIESGKDLWVLRHYRRGGAIARLVHDRYVWTGASRTRCYREWRLLACMRAWNLPVPAPIAARYVREGLLYRADLITAAIPDVRTLASLVIAGLASHATWQAVGFAIARFHAHGVQHADLNAHNILLNGHNEVFILDFDRGQIRTRGRWEEGVLARLQRSLLKISAQHVNVSIASDAWSVLEAAYSSASYYPPAATR